MVGAVLGRLLAARGIAATVLERRRKGTPAPRPFMLGYHGYPALEELGILEEVRATGWDVAPQAGSSIGLAVDFTAFIEVLAEGVPVSYEHTIVELLRDGERVAGVVAQGPTGREEITADLVVACDGLHSPTRSMAGLAANISDRGEGGLAFMSSAVIDRSFAMKYLSYGGVIILIGWQKGSAGWWTIDKVGRDAALAPGLDAFKRSFARLLPEATAAVEGIGSIDDLVYSEPQILTCPQWWRPGVVVVGDAAHFFSPETGVAAGLSLGDAQALAAAIAQHPDDPDAACALYSAWREPIVRPFEAADPSHEQRIAASADRARPIEEQWPPVAA